MNSPKLMISFYVSHHREWFLYGQVKLAFRKFWPATFCSIVYMTSPIISALKYSKEYILDIDYFYVSISVLNLQIVISMGASKPGNYWPDQLNMIFQAHQPFWNLSTTLLKSETSPLTDWQVGVRFLFIYASEPSS